MKINYLFAITPEQVATKDEWARDGEPVVPWYPSTLNNVFLSIGSFKPAVHAIVETRDIDPDVLCADLCRMYPGLPDSLHANYVMGTAVAASKFKPGTKLRIIVEEDKATVYSLDGSQEYCLWEEQPI